MGRTIFNIMFAQQFGGIERVFCDYARVLQNQGTKVINIIRPQARSKEYLKQQDKDSYICELTCRNKWDILCAYKLNQLVQKYQPKLLICHGNRAVAMAKLIRTKIPIVGVTHNYSIKQQLYADRLICLTKDLQNAVVKHGYDIQHTTIIPNMVTALPYVRRQYKAPVVIGAVGRFMHKKGFDLFIEALNTLQQQGIEFRAILAGDGEQKKNLMHLRSQYKLDAKLKMPGWIDNMSEFYADIDILVLPSRIESFGVVLLEAMSHSTPIIATKAPGPLSIIQHGVDGLLVEKEDPAALASAIKRLIHNAASANNLAKNANAKVWDYYADKVIGHKLQEFIDGI